MTFNALNKLPAGLSESSKRVGFALSASVLAVVVSVVANQAI